MQVGPLVECIEWHQDVPMHELHRQQHEVYAKGRVYITVLVSTLTTVFQVSSVSLALVCIWCLRWQGIYLPALVLYPWEGMLVIK